VAEVVGVEESDRGEADNPELAVVPRIDRTSNIREVDPIVTSLIASSIHPPVRPDDSA